MGRKAASLADNSVQSIPQYMWQRIHGPAGKTYLNIPVLKVYHCKGDMLGIGVKCVVFLGNHIPHLFTITLLCFSLMVIIYTFGKKVLFVTSFSSCGVLEKKNHWEKKVCLVLWIFLFSLLQQHCTVNAIDIYHPM